MNFRPGDIFKLKSYVSDKSLDSIGFGPANIKYIRNKTSFIVIKTIYADHYPDRVYWRKENGVVRYFKLEFCEPLNSVSRGHPMTKMFRT